VGLKSPQGNWLRSNGFVLALILAVMMAFAFPQPGAQGGALHADIINNFGIALILFLQGLSLSLEKIKRGAGNWRLHLLIQAFTFGVFPLAGLVLHKVIPRIWVSEPEPIRDGFLYLCVLPSTVSTSVVLTAIARGNTATALFNAAFSNILGVFFTPLLIQLLMRKTGQSAPFGPLLIKILLLTLLPFFIGMLLRRLVVEHIERHKVWVSRLSNAVIVFIVYSAFCDSVQQRIWQRYSLAMTGLVFFWVAGLFVGMSGIIYGTCLLLRLNEEDAIAAYFCSVKKTLAMGVPLAMLIFGKRADLSLILLPIMFYHPLQLFVNGLLANRWAQRPQTGIHVSNGTDSSRPFGETC
jgi:solute carrier family 10 (sodium/bile acid cotransporter), member 7